MDISLDTIQQLAPDQPSLNAAKKLLQPAKWPLRGKAAAVNSIWGQCQGSGSKPYYIMADVVEHGYKCTCPSRKFPCKHVLALMWQFAEGAADFNESEPPEWVHDWLGRKRKSTTAEPSSEKVAVKKDIANAQEEIKKVISPEEKSKKEAANIKRAAQNKAKTTASINAGLQEFQQWVDDQLRTGISGFIKEINDRCRRIAARLVDAKAAGLASRLDEFPAKLIALPIDQQPAMVFKELGQLLLLSEAWLTDNEEVDAHRAITTAENREQLLANKNRLSHSGNWQSVGEKVITRRDGLVSHSTWLLNIDDESARFALLLDHYPASAGRREVALRTGSQITGTIAYYPSRSPLRGFLVEQQAQENSDSSLWPASTTELHSAYAQFLGLIPWSEEMPYMLSLGRIMQDTQGHYWWKNKQTQQRIMLSNKSIPLLLLGGELSAAFILYNGDSAELLSAQSAQWGVIAC
jgi:hypothetical protein